MNNLTKEISRLMQPTAALIVYYCDDSYLRRNYYLELRNINKSGLMEAGKPVSLNFIQSLTDNFSIKSSSSAPHGEIPKRLLYADVREGKYVWYSLPGIKYMYFKSDLNIPNGEYCLPGLVWMVAGKSLYTFAYRSKRLKPCTQLFSAPFFNVRPNDGSVCLGNAKLEQPENLNFLNFLKFWEDKFFLSEFSHILGSNPVRNNLVTVIKNSVTSFDSKELIPIKKMKLKNLLK
jgi:PRTRC genetic system protein B